MIVVTDFRGEGWDIHPLALYSVGKRGLVELETAALFFPHNGPSFTRRLSIPVFTDWWPHETGTDNPIDFPSYQGRK